MPIQPQVDAEGRIVPHDHPGIANDHVLYRGITQLHLSPDGKGGRRVSSMAYNGGDTYETGMSMDSAVLMAEAGVDAQVFMKRSPYVGAVQFVAGALRGEGLQVGADPEEDDPFHCQAWGAMTQGKKNRLRQAAAWFVPIVGVSLT